MPNLMNPIMNSKVIYCHNDREKGPVIALKVDSHEEQLTGVDGVKLLVNKKTTVLTLKYVLNEGNWQVFSKEIKTELMNSEDHASRS